MTVATLTYRDRSVTDAPLDAKICLPRIPEAVAAARLWLTENLTKWGACDDTVQDAVQIISEVYTNSVIHSAGADDATVTAVWFYGHLRVAVSDPDLRIPTPDLAEDEHGRGLIIVSMLAARWGETKTAAGKKVWFELDERGDRT